MSNVALQIAVIVLLILLNGLFAMSETALVSSRKARLRQRAEEGARGARTALALAASPNRFLSTVQIGISLIGVLAGAFGGATLAEPLAGVLRGGPMRLISVVTSPAIWFLSASTDAVLRLLRVRSTPEYPVSEQEVEILMEEGARAGVFEEEERDLVQRALGLDDRPVRELMTPRPEVVWLDADGPQEEVLREAREAGHSYFPVARGDLDDLLGITSVKDTWARQASGETADMLGSLQPAPLVPEGAPATDALVAFKRFSLPAALVIDARGHIEGLVTLTDILEALVGQVPDEVEPAEEAIVRREDGSWLVDGLLAAEDMKERLGLSRLPREEKADYQTVGGMVMDALGRVPAPGDRFEWEGYYFEVVDMDGRRVDKVLMAPAHDAPAGETS